ncbi:rhomboid family intramembrane serine protease [Phototrophicus methaneseepsis]|uniref:Rhomboid family intramembrane serine protease n=1 Tax=Phototrophicus methaneseepsis TaxID=2710758 RepID=A0A7S8IDU0_9CHLR|nr:rhomboid family intramembrane serine protease [Phototrophicus methaneseepsis]QPC82980.1 rhomboid family intramembrane serine protease [Phototrophicus methaneseepsis]
MTHPTDNDPAQHPLEADAQHAHPRHPLDQAPVQRKAAPAQPRKKPEQLIRLPQRVKKPYATYVLLGLNIAIFVVGLLSAQANEWLLYHGVNIPYLTTHGEPWRLVTSMFLHANIMHIFFNGYALFYLGKLLEPLFGRTRFLLIYFLGGLGGSVLGTLMNEGGLGASGAVFALWAGELLYLYRNQGLYGEWGRQRMRQSMIFMGLNFAYGLFVNLTAEAGGTLIGNFAHLGGLIGGALLTYAIGPRIHIPPQTPTIINDIKVYDAEDQNASLTNWLPWLVAYGIGLLIIMVVAAQIISL